MISMGDLTARLGPPLHRTAERVSALLGHRPQV